MVPDWLRRKRPSGNALLVYVNLGSFGTWNPGTARYDECRPSLDRLVEETGLSKSTVKRAIAELLELGAIERQAQHKNDHTSLPSKYRLIFGEVVEPRTGGRGSRVDPYRSTGGQGRGPRVSRNQEPDTKNQSVSEVHWSGAPDGAPDDDDPKPLLVAAESEPTERATFTDWRAEDRALFRSIVGDRLSTDGVKWRPAGSFDADVWYEALRRQSGRPMEWPGRYLDKLHGDRGLEEWLAARGLTADDGLGLAA